MNRLDRSLSTAFRSACFLVISIAVFGCTVDSNSDLDETARKAVQSDGESATTPQAIAAEDPTPWPVKALVTNELVNIDISQDCFDEALAFEFELDGLDSAVKSLQDLSFAPTFEDGCTELQPEPKRVDGGVAKPCNPLADSTTPAPAAILWNASAGPANLQWWSGASNFTAQLPTPNLGPGTVSRNKLVHFGYSPMYQPQFLTSHPLMSSVPVAHTMVARFYEMPLGEPSEPQEPTCATSPISLTVTSTDRFTGTLSVELGGAAPMMVQLDAWEVSRTFDLGDLVVGSDLVANDPVATHRLTLGTDGRETVAIPISRDAKGLVMRTTYQWQDAQLSRIRMTAFHGYPLAWRTADGEPVPTPRDDATN